MERHTTCNTFANCAGMAWPARRGARGMVVLLSPASSVISAISSIGFFVFMRARHRPAPAPLKSLRVAMRSIVRFLDRLSDLGAGLEESDDARLRHGTLIFASVLIALISVIWVADYFAYGYPTAAAIPA
jgi:hypothetical protein